jgi:ATP-dependent HslUV protease ATP-binding subunit HslU
MNKELVPKKIVAYLDDYIIRQTNAKRAIAIAIRNRYRRMQLPKELQEEITPKNIMMIGSTGVGKTEIARRLSKMMHIPFVKVEASKFTQVGFVGRDVESMVRDLLAVSISLVKGEFRKSNNEEIENYVLDEITKKIIPPLPKGASDNKQNDYERSFETMKRKVSDGTFDDKLIKINMPDKKRNGDNGAPLEMQEMQDSLSSLMSKISNKQNQKEVTVKNAKRILIDEAIENIISEDDIITEALIRAESGMIFIDEVDKIASNSSSKQSDPGKEGVQRDLLPIVEGSSVNTKYGILKTDHILFISAGAFSISKPSDLIPELQGRFPIRVELEDLNEDDIFQILNSTKNSLIKQYEALFSVEGVGLIFTEESIKEIAKYTYQANQKVENIGARRMHTVLEKILEDFSFEADEKSGESITITKKIVQDKLSFLIEDEDISRYIL